MTGEGRYRIRAVSELTGVSEATLRAWERRYALPVPERTPSGYRLYSPLDVEQVRRMRELTDSGMAPVDAARLIAEGAEARSAPSPRVDADSFAASARRIAEATRRLDPPAIEAEVRFAMTLTDAVSIVECIFRPALSKPPTAGVGASKLRARIVSACPLLRSRPRRPSPCEPGYGQLLPATRVSTSSGAC